MQGMCRSMGYTVQMRRVYRSPESWNRVYVMLYINEENTLVGIHAGRNTTQQYDNKVAIVIYQLGELIV